MDVIFSTTRISRTDTPYTDAADSEVEATPVLRQASLATAVQFGGPLVSRLLETAPLAGDREHVIVDTKVSYLMPGWYPAIPGWHTDGVPRAKDGKGAPSIAEQMRLDTDDYRPRYHTIHVGSAKCPTEFVAESFAADVPDNDRALYKVLSDHVNSIRPETFVADPGVWDSWSWDSVHRARASESTGWRLLIRVSETDFLPPRATGFIRSERREADG